MRHLVHALAHNAGDALETCTRLKAQEQHLELVAGIVLLVYHLLVHTVQNYPIKVPKLGTSFPKKFKASPQPLFYR